MADSSLLAEISKALVEALPNEGRRRIVVAVSGGIDSVVLLRALVDLREELQLKLIVAHLDHGLREQSASDAEFVATLAKSYDIECVVESAGKRPETENLEAWGREERYKFFESTRSRFSASMIVTAHHRDDLVETLLWRVVSGRLATDAHTLAARDMSRHLLRPMFRVTRQQIVEFQERNSLKYVHDHTNNDLDRTRNRIRHELIPELRRSYNPNLIDSLAEVSDRLGADERLLWQVARGVLEEEPESNIMELPLALQWRVLKLHCIAQVGETGERLGYRTLQRLIRDLDDGSISEGDLGFGIRVQLVGKGERLPFSLKNFSFTLSQL